MRRFTDGFTNIGISACVLTPFDENVQVVEFSLVVKLLECVQFLVICLAVGVNFNRA